MGMYTELVLEIKIKQDERVIETLKYMLGKSKECPAWEHKLFKTQRWSYMLNCDSPVFDGQTDSKLYLEKDECFLNVRSNFKDYDNEIAKFLDWINPYVLTEGFLGYMRYEEDTFPDLIFKANGEGIIIYKYGEKPNETENRV